MGSVMSFDDCPHCKSEESFHEDYNYKTGESYRFCTLCGYLHNEYYEREEDGQLKKKDPSIEEFSFDNLVWKTVIYENPGGVVHIKSKSGGGSMSVIPTIEDYQKLDFSDIDKTLVESIKITKLVDGVIQTETVFDHL